MIVANPYCSDSTSSFGSQLFWWPQKFPMSLLGTLLAPDDFPILLLHFSTTPFHIHCSLSLISPSFFSEKTLILFFSGSSPLPLFSVKCDPSDCSCILILYWVSPVYHQERYFWLPISWPKFSIWQFLLLAAVFEFQSPMTTSSAYIELLPSALFAQLVKWHYLIISVSFGFFWIQTSRVIYSQCFSASSQMKVQANLS